MPPAPPPVAETTAPSDEAPPELATVPVPLQKVLPLPPAPTVTEKEAGARNAVPLSTPPAPPPPPSCDPPPPPPTTKKLTRAGLFPLHAKVPDAVNV